MSDTVPAVVSGCMAWLSWSRTMASLPSGRREGAETSTVHGQKGSFIGGDVDVYQRFFDSAWLGIHSNSAIRDLLALFFTCGVALMAIIGISGYVKRLAAKIFSEEEPSPSKKIASPRSPACASGAVARRFKFRSKLVDTTKMAQPSSIAEQTTSRFNKL